MACMGYWSAFTHLGMEFMLDIHGRMLYAQSKDSHYFTNGGIGVSKFYPMITGTDVAVPCVYCVAEMFERCSKSNIFVQKKSTTTLVLWTVMA